MGPAWTQGPEIYLIKLKVTDGRMRERLAQMVFYVRQTGFDFFDLRTAGICSCDYAIIGQDRRGASASPGSDEEGSELKSNCLSRAHE